MAEAGIRAGKAFVEMFLEDSRLRRGLKNAGRAVQRFGRQMGQMGMQMARIGAAIAAPLAISTKVFASFDDQMRATKAVTTGTEEEFKALTETAKELGRTTSFTASEVAGAMKNLGKAGFSRGDIKEGIDDVLALARATETDLPEAAKIAGDALRQFGLGADQAARVSDVLTATANNSAQGLNDLGESLKYAGPVADEFGLTIEDTAKALGALANFGIRGSQAGTNMRKIFLQLSDPSIRKRLDKLGVSVTDMNKEFRPFGDILSDIGRKVEDMPGPERLALFGELFGQRAVTGGAKLTAAAFDQLNDAIDKSGGTAKRTAEEMDAGIGGSLRKLWSAIEGVAIAIGDALSEDISELAAILASSASDIAKFISENKEIIKVVALVASGLIAAGSALIAVSGVIAVVGFAFSGIATVISGTITVLGGLLTALTALVSPLGAVLLVIGYLAVEAFKFMEVWDTATNVVAEKWKTLVAVLKQGGLLAAVKVIWAQIKLLFAQGTAFALGMWIKFTTGLETAWVKATSNIRLALFIMIEGILDGMIKLAAGSAKILNKIKGFFDKSFDVKAQDKAVDALAGTLRTKSREFIGGGAAESEKMREEALDRINKKRESGLSALQEDVDKASANLQQAIRDGLKKEKEAAVEEAAKAPDPTSGGRGGGGPGEFKFDSSAGTFSAAAARLLGGATEEKKNRKANEKTADHTGALFAYVRDNQLTFI